MRSWIECVLLACCLVLGPTVTRVQAQVGEVMDDAEAGEPEEEADDAPGAHTDDEDASEDEDAPDYDVGEDEERIPMEYRLGHDTPFEVGGHVGVTMFTRPGTPKLDTGVGFQGTLATHLWRKLVAQAGLGLLLNSSSGGEATYQMAQVRGGVRYPIDLGAKPVLFFVGAGLALNILWVSLPSASGSSETTSALAPSVDLQVGALFEVTERISIELALQGAYITSNEVYGHHDGSWVAAWLGATYDL